MNKMPKIQWTTENDFAKSTELWTSSKITVVAEAFLKDRKAQNMADGTLYFHYYKLKYFIEHCESKGVDDIQQLDSNFLREYLISLSEGHNPGGVHGFFRSLKAMLRWYEAEYQPENWKNPIERVKPPKQLPAPLEPVPMETIFRMLDVCGKTFYGFRDTAILLCLIDTGCRANELLSINISDCDQSSGEILIRFGKGNKSRVVFIGSRTRRAVRLYLQRRTDEEDALFISENGERMQYDALRNVIRSLASKADVERPELHDFRRAFALNSLRAGMDVYSLQKIMGHSDLQTLQRYLAQTTDDLAIAHKIASPVDRWKK